ncbi:MAG: sigma-54-dependent Fis family transcriptional regulator [Psychroflexus sp.]|nr:sigma-54-dependent Fis family transcriptional regulator [Psychroflexus sp.]
MSKLLIVEDEEAIRRVLVKILKEDDSKYQIEVASNGVEAIELIKNQDFDLILCDIKMPKMDGIEVLEKTKAEYPELPIVMISGHGDLETAVETMRKGAFDYISKPPDLNRLLQTVKIALDHNKLATENKSLKRKVSKKYEMIGESDAMKGIKSMIDKVAPTDARILITGENGTGKELVAHWIHQKSERSKSPMVEVNCAAIPSELIESELFGHLKGAFTSANKSRAGKFEAANGGTLFLDEVGDMSLSAQAKVLRALQENKIQRVGSDKDIKVDVRVIAATNKDLKQEIKDKKFREDLYHRLAVIMIPVPSLNERPEDIPSLVDHFLKTIANEQGVTPKTIEDKALEVLKQYQWTGNIRELRNVIERLIILGGDTITVKDVEQFSQKS